MQARRGWQEVLEVIKSKDLQPRLPYPAKLSFRMEGQVKCFPDKVKIKESLSKIKRILKAAREKETVTYKGVPIRLSADFSKETLQTRRGWQEVFQGLKGKDLHPRLLYPAKLK